MPPGDPGVSVSFWPCEPELLTLIFENDLAKLAIKLPPAWSFMLRSLKNCFKMLDEMKCVSNSQESLKYQSCDYSGLIITRPSSDLISKKANFL